MQREVSGNQACDRWKKPMKVKCCLSRTSMSSMPRTQSFNTTREILRPREAKFLARKSLTMSYGTPTTDTQVPSPNATGLCSLTHSRDHKSIHIRKYHCSHILYLRACCRNEKVSKKRPLYHKSGHISAVQPKTHF